MDCKHERYKSRNNRFFCLICGAEIPNPFTVVEIPAVNQDAPEGEKKPVKRKRKGAAE